MFHRSTLPSLQEAIAAISQDESILKPHDWFPTRPVPGLQQHGLSDTHLGRVSADAGKTARIGLDCTRKCRSRLSRTSNQT
jgi:hypothetical protein